MLNKPALTCFLLLLTIASGCHKSNTSPAASYDQQGIASWYGHPFDGRKTASGEVFQLTALTAAHRTYPFGTVLRVVNKKDMSSVDVRVNDRGPFVSGRIIDLSQAAAMKIGVTGTADVGLEVLSRPKSRGADSFAVQVGDFVSEDEAESLRKSMPDTYGPSHLIRRDEDQKWHVLVGMKPTLEGAEMLSQRISREHGPSFAVLIDPEE